MPAASLIAALKSIRKKAESIAAQKRGAMPPTPDELAPVRDALAARGLQLQGAKLYGRGQSLFGAWFNSQSRAKKNRAVDEARRIALIGHAARFVEAIDEAREAVSETSETDAPNAKYSKPKTLADWSQDYGLSRNKLSTMFQEWASRGMARKVGRKWQVSTSEMPADEDF